MRQFWSFIKTTIIGGVVFLLPVAATIVVVAKFGEVAVKTVAPLAKKLPLAESEASLSSIGGCNAARASGFLGGLIARSLPPR